MQYEQLIIEIQDQTGLPRWEDAEEALRATLETLAAGIPEDLADELAFQLPQEIANAVRPPALVAAGGADRLDRREFVHRIAERCHLDDNRAAQIIPAVFTAIEHATGAAVMDHIRDALPTELRGFIHATGATSHFDDYR